jgi:hypothetical protein
VSSIDLDTRDYGQSTGLEPHRPQAGELDAIVTQIIPQARDLGGFEVRSARPAPARQTVGPLNFSAQIGPAEFLTGTESMYGRGRISGWRP